MTILKTKNSEQNFSPAIRVWLLTNVFFTIGLAIILSGANDILVILFIGFLFSIFMTLPALIVLLICEFIFYEKQTDNQKALFTYCIAAIATGLVYCYYCHEDFENISINILLSIFLALAFSWKHILKSFTTLNYV